MMMSRSGLRLVAPLIVGIPAAAVAGPSFPDLGRAAVVDAAGVIPDAAERSLTDRIVKWDQSTGHQLVVATVPSLQGYDIRDFGHQLGRSWRLGQKSQDDGVIILLAPNERKVRIEVGYGLEHALTDQVTAEIISGTIAPKLKAGDTAGALSDGADMIMTLAYDKDAASQGDVSRGGRENKPLLIVGILVAAIGCLALILVPRIRFWRRELKARRAERLARARRNTGAASSSSRGTIDSDPR